MCTVVLPKFCIRLTVYWRLYTLYIYKSLDLTQCEILAYLWTKPNSTDKQYSLVSHLPKDQPILYSSHCKTVAKYMHIEMCLYLSQIHQPNKKRNMPSKLPDNNRLKRLKATEKSVGFSGPRWKEYYCRWRSLG